MGSKRKYEGGEVRVSGGYQRPRSWLRKIRRGCGLKEASANRAIPFLQEVNLHGETEAAERAFEANEAKTGGTDSKSTGRATRSQLTAHSSACVELEDFPPL